MWQNEKYWHFHNVHITDIHQTWNNIKQSLPLHLGPQVCHVKIRAHLQKHVQ